MWRDIVGRNANSPSQADFRQPEWQKYFFGKNYPALQKIKAKYDPEDVFYAVTAVGSEAWKQHKDGRLCRVGHKGSQEAARFRRRSVEWYFPSVAG